MIDPSLLTPENGFHEDVFVAIEFQNDHLPFTEELACIFRGVFAHGPVFKETLGQNDDWILPNLDEAISIRPLTGPMTIWNLAPEWADYCTIDETSISWWKNSMYPKSMTLQSRPFWAKKKA